MGLYTILENIDNRHLFVYIIIILFSIFYFKRFSIGINIIIALFFGLAVINYLNEKNTVSNEIEDIQQETKLDAIKPDPVKLRERKDTDIIDYIFSIQDLYEYNPEAYEEMIDNINNFLTVHDIIFKGTIYCDDYYQIADSKKNNALNALHSIIYSLPNSRIVNEKFNRAHKRLETILNKHLNELYDQCQHELIIKGYNVNRRAINTGPKEYNHYHPEKEYSYQFY